MESTEEKIARLEAENLQYRTDLKTVVGIVNYLKKHKDIDIKDGDGQMAIARKVVGLMPKLLRPRYVEKNFSWVMPTVKPLIERYKNLV
jgi:hypothetical protein